MLIAHATDRSGDDAPAFVYACALAAASGGKLVTVHVSARAVESNALPDAGVLGDRWNKAFRYEHRRYDECDDVADTLLEALRELAPTLVIVGTHARHGLATALRGSVGEAVARNVRVPTLVVPNAIASTVDPATGAIDLGCIVIPARTIADAHRGLAAARRFVEMVGSPAARFQLVHVGPLDRELASFDDAVLRVDGPVDDAILDAARTHGARMVVMPTSGHDGVADVVLGSHTERVIRDSPCPVLSVPR